MVEKRHREALKANNRMNKYGNSKPPKQKIKITIGKAAVKWENYLSIPKLHDRSSLPPGIPSTRMVSHPSGEIPREASQDCCSSLLEEESDASLSAQYSTITNISEGRLEARPGGYSNILKQWEPRAQMLHLQLAQEGNSNKHL